MFKTLLASTFLLFNVNTCNAIKPNHNNANVGGGVYELYGAYCFRDVSNFPNQDYNIIPMGSGFSIISNIDEFNANYDAKVCWQSLGDTYVNNTTIREFEIDHKPLSYGHSDDCYIIYLSDGEYSFNVEMHVDTGALDFEYSDIQSMVLFFPVPLSIDADYYAVFNSLFTGGGNSFVSTYTGWYTLTSPNYQTNFKLNGFFTVNNNLYNQIEYFDYTAYATLNYGYNSQSETITIVDNKQLQVRNTILFSNVLIPNYARSSLLSVGVLGYAYEPVQYTFGDMIFSVVDAPVYMLSQLFSFELFGLQFYIAFMGVVTIVLICFVLKKII